VIPAQYVWLVWASAFLAPWIVLYAKFPDQRRAMVWASLFTTPFGLTEPLFVPEYWNPPSLFDLANRTGFDIESLIFCFGVGGIAAVLVNAATRTAPLPMPEDSRRGVRHRFHRWVLFAPFVTFVVLLPTGWNPIYAGLVATTVGAGLTVWCRPDLGRKTVLGALAFLAYYAVFLTGLELTAPPGYIDTVWNLDALSGVQLGFMPLEELLWAAGFGAYWAGLYEHFRWHWTQVPIARGEDPHS